MAAAVVCVPWEVPGVSCLWLRTERNRRLPGDLVLLAWATSVSVMSLGHRSLDNDMGTPVMVREEVYASIWQDAVRGGP